LFKPDRRCRPRFAAVRDVVDSERGSWLALVIKIHSHAGDEPLG